MDEDNNLKKRHTILNFFIIILLVIVCITLYSRYISTTGLKVIENSIVDTELPSSFNGFKIVQFSDIHYGRTTRIEEVKNVVNNINKLKPDLVIFSGDLFDNDIKINENDVNKLKDELSKIKSNINKYAVKGDCDYKYLTEFETVFKYANFTILDNINEFVFYKGNTPIKIIGTTSLLKSKIDYTNAFNTFGDENEYFTILVSHEPKVIKNIDKYKVNVAFTSHSLGGLINIPFIGGVIKFKGSDNYIKGFYQVNNTKMYVNSGIGTQKYNFRYFNRPSINLYRLYNY